MRHASLLSPVVVLLLFLLAVAPASAQGETTVTLLHLTDYHSHALPFYNEGKADTAGIARVLAYLKEATDEPNTLIFSGGDTMNKGTPAWSDKYKCAEWPWFNDILDAMAYGNHDSDYGPAAFAECRKGITYPILGSNVLDAAGAPLFAEEGKTYRIFEVSGVKIGVFAVAGSDFSRLLRPETLPAEGATFSDRVAVAKAEIAAMEAEGAQAIVLIGHALYEEDVALAQAVPGIDLIFGTHSHRKQELTQVPGTETSIISPFQYLTYLSRVELTFAGGELTGLSGELVPMSSDLPEDAEIRAQVDDMQAELEADPTYAPLFAPIGEAAVELSTSGQFTGEAVLGNFVMDIFRAAAGSHMAISTSSSFREPIPPGPILEETLRTALPYKNKVLLYEMTGAQIQELLDYSVSRSPSDFFSQVSGVRFAIADGKATNVQILKDPSNPSAGFAALAPQATYSVATSDFQALIAGGYKEIFAKAPAPREPGIADFRDEVRRFIQANSPVTSKLDGRMSATEVATPTALPAAGAVLPVGQAVALGGSLVLLAGLGLRRLGR